MKNYQNILILDSQLRRGATVEEVLRRGGFQVFHTSRMREALQIIKAINPNIVVVAWDGEGAAFYRSNVLREAGGNSDIFYIVVGPSGLRELRSQDILIEMDDGTPSKKPKTITRLSEEVLRAARYLASKLEGMADKSRFKNYQVSGESASSQRDSTPAISPFTPLSSQIASQREKSYPTTPPSTPTIKPRRRPDEGKKSHKTPMPWADRNSKQNTWSNPPDTVSGLQGRQWKGLLEHLDLAKLLGFIHLQKPSGYLVLSIGVETRTIWFENGLVITASSDRPLPSFANLLIQEGIITRSELEKNPELATKRVGIYLFNMKKMEHSEIIEVQRLYTEQVVLSSFEFEAGKFLFSYENPPPLKFKFSLPLDNLVLQGVREYYSEERLNKLLKSRNLVPYFKGPSELGSLNLLGIEQQIVKLIDGKKSIDTLIRISRVESRIVLSVIYGLYALRLIKFQDNSKSVQSHSQNDLKRVNSTTGGSVIYREKQSSSSSTDRQPAILTEAPEKLQTPAKGVPHYSNFVKSEAPKTNRTTTTLNYRTLNNTASNSKPSLPRYPTRNNLMAINPTKSELQSISLMDAETAKKQIEQKFRQILTEDYFQILEITPDVSNMAIRRAYQRVKLAFSPERYSNEIVQKYKYELEEIRKTIEDAYSILSDPLIRERYTQHRYDL